MWFNYPFKGKFSNFDDEKMSFIELIAWFIVICCVVGFFLLSI